jgi:hypothetical protein
VQFSPELRAGVLSGEITVSIRLWKTPKVKLHKRYAVGFGEIEVDAIDVVDFGSITAEDVAASGEVDRESLRRRAAHAGPISDSTFVYRIEFHMCGSGTG